MTSCRLCGASSGHAKIPHVPGCVGENPLLIEWERLHGAPSASRFFRFDAKGTVPANAFDRRQELAQKYAWAVPNEAALDTLLDLAPIVEIGAGTGYWAALLRSRGIVIDAFDAQPPTLTSRTNIYHRETKPWTIVAQGSSEVLGPVPSVLLTFRSQDGTIVTDDTWRECCGIWWFSGPREALVQRVFSECAPRSRVANTMNGRCSRCGKPLDRFENATLFLCWPPYERTTMALDCLRAFRGQSFVHVGEADREPGAAEFFAELRRGWRLDCDIGEVEIPRWQGVTDVMTVWRRR